MGSHFATALAQGVIRRPQYRAPEAVGVTDWKITYSASCGTQPTGAGGAPGGIDHEASPARHRGGGHVRHLASSAAALLVVLGLSSCASPSRGAAETARDDAGLYEASVSEWVGALNEGMERARLDLARRAMLRLMREPG